MALRPPEPPAVRQSNRPVPRSTALLAAARSGAQNAPVLSAPRPSLAQAGRGPSGPPSLWEQATQAVSSLPAGLAGLAGQGVQSAAGLVRAPIDIGRMAIDRNYDPVAGDTTDFGTVGEHYFPLLETFRGSFADTGRRVRDPSRYADAVREGTILGTVLEDVGNVSVLGAGAGMGIGAAGRATGSARLAQAGSRITDVARMGDRAGAAPAQVYIQGARALRPAARLADRGFQRVTGRPSLAEAARGSLDRNVFNPGRIDPDTAGAFRMAVEPARRAIASSRLNPAVRRAGRTLDDSRMHTDTAMLPQIRAMLDLEQLTPEALAATNVIRQGYGQQFRAMADLPPAEFAAFVERTFGDATDITPQSLRTAIDYESGVLGGTLRDQIDQARRVMDDIEVTRTEGASLLDGETPEAFRARTGREFPLDPEQRGTAPLTRTMEDRLRTELGLSRSRLSPDDAIARRRADADRSAAAATDLRALADEATPGTPQAIRLDERARAAEQRANRAARKAARYEEKVSRLRDEIAKSAEAAPARFRRNIRAFERGIEALDELAQEFPQSAALFAKIADEVPGTLNALVDAGIDPAHLIGGRVTPRTLRSLGVTRSGLPREGRTTTTRQARGDVVEFDVRNQLIQEAQEARRLAARRAAQEFDGQYAVSAADVIPPSELGGLRGAALRERMGDFGYEAWNPRAILDIVPDNQISANTRFLPRALKDAFTYTIDTSTPSAAWQLLAAGNQKFKNALLPLSPTWYMGNTVGNALMAMVGQGMDPFTYTSRLMQEWSHLRRTGELNMPRRATTTGLSFQESQVLTPQSLTRRTPMRFGYGRMVRDPAYRFVADWLDDANKAVVYNHALEQARSNPAVRSQLKDVAVQDARRALRDAESQLARYADDVPDAAYARIERARQDLSRVEASDAPFIPEEYALRQALNVMGDYARMAPWEQKMVQVMPFYRWARHITQLSLRLPFEHPARVAWTLHLAELFDNSPDDMPGFLRGAIPLPGGWMLPSRSLNPFGDIGSNEGGPLLNPDEFLRSTSPFLKLPVAALTGRNLGRGGDPLTRPFGTGVIDPSTGREDMSPALVSLFPQNTRWGELAHFATGQLPIARNLRDLAQGQAGVSRYDTGQPVRIGGVPARNESIYGPLAPLAQIANLPRPMSPQDAARARLRFVENLQRSRRTQQNYRSRS